MLLINILLFWEIFVFVYLILKVWVCKIFKVILGSFNLNKCDKCKENWSFYVLIFIYFGIWLKNIFILVLFFFKLCFCLLVF